MDLQNEKSKLMKRISNGSATDIDKKRLMKINNAINMGKTEINDSKTKTRIVNTKTRKNW